MFELKYRIVGTERFEWSSQSLNRLSVRWIVTHGPRVCPPKRAGFGARVMERMIQSQINGEVKFDWREEGIVCEIAIDI